MEMLMFVFHCIQIHGGPIGSLHCVSVGVLKHILDGKGLDLLRISRKPYLNNVKLQYTMI